MDEPMPKVEGPIIPRVQQDSPSEVSTPPLENEIILIDVKKDSF
jgi:hypothetical protein